MYCFVGTWMGMGRDGLGWMPSKSPPPPPSPLHKPALRISARARSPLSTGYWSERSGQRSGQVLGPLSTYSSTR